MKYIKLDFSKNRQELLSSIFSVLEKFLGLSLFIVPLRGIRDIYKGSITSTFITKPLFFLKPNIGNYPPLAVYSFYLLFLLFIFIVVKFLNKRVLRNLKKNKINRELSLIKGKEDSREVTRIRKIVNKSEAELKFKSVLYFCILLLILLFFIDKYIFFIILIFGILSNYIYKYLESINLKFNKGKNVKNYINKIKDSNQESLQSVRKEFWWHFYSTKNILLNELIGPCINTFIMLAIMILIFFRTRDPLSIIFFFAIRLYITQFNILMVRYNKKNRKQDFQFN